MLSEPAVATLIGKIYDLGLDRHNWRRLAEDVAQLFEAPIASLSLRRPDSGIEFRASFGIERALAESYNEYFWTKDFIFRRVWEQPRGVAHAVQFLNSDAEVLKTEFYNGYLRPAGCCHAVVSMSWPVHESTVTVGVARNSNQKPFEQDDADRLSVISTHFRRAAYLGSELERAKTKIDFSFLNCLTFGVIVIDSLARATFVNTAAEAILHGQSLRLKANRLVAPDCHDGKALDEALAAATQAAAAPSIRAVQICRDTGHPLTLVVMQLPAGGYGADHERGAAAAVFISDPTRSSCPSDYLRQVYELTLQETRIAAALIKGRGLGDAARDLGIGRETARFHLKNIYQKTNTHSQAELAHLVLTNAAAMFGGGVGYEVRPQ